MTKAKRKQGFGKTHWGRIALVWAVALGTVFYVVPRDKLPQFLKANPLIISAYDLKGAGRTAAGMEPAAGETGYEADDRRELDSLISRGTYQ